MAINYMEAKESLISNFEVVYEDLNKAVGECIGEKHNSIELKYVNAYLAATIHAMLDYIDRYIKDDESVLAFKYVNNSIKHVKGFVTHSTVSGGVSFPIEFPIEFTPINVIWKNEAELDVRHKEQKEAYNNIFAGHEIMKSIKPMADKILSGYQNKK